MGETKDEFKMWWFLGIEKNLLHQDFQGEFTWNRHKDLGQNDGSPLMGGM